MTSGAGSLTSARSERAAACLGPVCARANGLLWHAWVPGHSVVKPSPKPEHKASMMIGDRRDAVLWPFEDSKNGFVFAFFVGA